MMGRYNKKKLRNKSVTLQLKNLKIEIVKYFVLQLLFWFIFKMVFVWFKTFS